MRAMDRNTCVGVVGRSMSASSCVLRIAQRIHPVCASATVSA